PSAPCESRADSRARRTVSHERAPCRSADTSLSRRRCSPNASDRPTRSRLRLAYRPVLSRTARWPSRRRLRASSASAVWARGVALVDPRTWTRQFVGSRAGIAPHVQACPVVDPVDQAVAKHRIRSRDAVRQGDGVPHLARRVRIRNIDHADAVSVPTVEHKVLEHGRVVVLLCDVAATLAVRLRVGLVEAILETVIWNRERTD